MSKEKDGERRTDRQTTDGQTDEPTWVITENPVWVNPEVQNNVVNICIVNILRFRSYNEWLAYKYDLPCSFNGRI